MKKIQMVLGILTASSAAVAALVWFLVPDSSTEGMKFFLLFAVRQLVWDIFFACALCLGSFLVLQVSGATLKRQHLDSMLPRSKVLVALALIATFSLPTYYYARARKFYWNNLAREDYLTEALLSIGEQTALGRVHSASRMASSVFEGLQGTPEGEALRGVHLSLAARVKRSEQLAEQVTNERARAWNPMLQRRLYFQAAEAVRLNPENYVAAQALRTMHSALQREILALDASMLCRGVASSDQPRWYSISLLEGEALQSRGEEQKLLDASSCRKVLDDLWQIEDVTCLLVVSENTRRSKSNDLQPGDSLCSSPNPST